MNRVVNNIKAKFLYIKEVALVKKLYQTQNALHIAVSAHAGQFRRGLVDGQKVPYIIHPLSVAEVLLDLCCDFDTNTLDTLVAAALLHDVCEDTEYQNLSEYGVSEEVFNVVELLTKRSDKSEREYFSGIAGNKLARLIKLSDRLDNTKDSTNFTLEKWAKYQRETREEILPLAISNSSKCNYMKDLILQNIAA